MRTVWPSADILRASHWEPGQASIPTKTGSARAKNCSSVSRRNVAFWIGVPDPSRPTTWNRFLPISIPNTVAGRGLFRIVIALSFLKCPIMSRRTRRVIPLIVTPGLRRRAVTWAIDEKGYSQRRACRLVGLQPKTYRYVSTRPDDGPLRTRLKELASQRRRFGYRRLGLLLARQGVRINRKKLYRLYKEERLTVRKRGGRKRALGTAGSRGASRMARFAPRWHWC